MPTSDLSEQAWIEGLLGTHQVRLRGFIARYIDDRNDLLDLVQDTFLDAWRSRGQLDPARDAWPWLRTIAYRRVVDHLRRSHYRRPLYVRIIDDALLAPTPEESAGDDERLARLQRCLEAIDERHRRLLVRRFHLAQPLAEIATQLSENVGTVTMRVHRLCAHLRRCMDGNGVS